MVESTWGPTGAANDRNLNPEQRQRSGRFRHLAVFRGNPGGSFAQDEPLPGRPALVSCLGQIGQK